AGQCFATFVQGGPESLRGDLDAAARAADEAVTGIRDYLRDVYRPRTEGTPDAVGRDRYAVAARRWTGSDLGAGDGLEEAYAWGGRSTSGSSPSSGPRPRSSCPARRRWRPCAGSTSTARPSRASRRSA